MAMCINQHIYFIFKENSLPGKALTIFLNSNSNKQRLKILLSIFVCRSKLSISRYSYFFKIFTTLASFSFKSEIKSNFCCKLDGFPSDQFIIYSKSSIDSIKLALFVLINLLQPLL